MLKSDPKRQKDCPGAPGSASGPPNLTPRCLRKRKQRVFVARLARTLFSNRFFDIFCQISFFANPPKYRACRQNQGFGHSLCESLRSRNVTSKKHEN